MEEAKITGITPPAFTLSGICVDWPPYVLGENTPSGFARIDAYKGAHALLHGSMGRMPGTELGQPLPGTAPPPGTAIPPGLVQYFDPAAGLAPANPDGPPLPADSPPPPVTPAG